MFVHNTTFMLLREHEQEFLDWFTPRIPSLIGAGQNPRLSSMREAGGQDYTLAEAQSVAFQMDFENIAAIRLYEAGPLAGILADFEKEFGPEAMSFSSIFELLPL